MGVGIAGEVTQSLRRTRFDQEVTEEEVKRAVAAEISRLLAPVAPPLALDPARKPFVVLVVGVNRSGKTTTIGNLATHYVEAAIASRRRVGRSTRTATGA